MMSQELNDLRLLLFEASLELQVFEHLLIDAFGLKVKLAHEC